MAEESLPALRVGSLPARPARAAAFLAPLKRYAPVEARRNRVLYAGWPVIILGSLPLSGAIGSAVGLPWQQGLSAALAAWALAGLPLTAVLFGAVAGAGLRGAAEEAEAGLPLSPRARAFSALAAAGAAFGGNALLVAFLLLATNQDARELVGGIAALGNWGSVWGYLGATAGIAALSTAWLMTAAFAAAYAASHAILGGVAALLGGGVLLLPVGIGAAVHLNHAPDMGLPFLTGSLAAAAVSTVAAAGALAQAAPSVSRGRRLSWPRLALACLLPLSGSLGAWPALWSSGRAVRERLQPAWGGWDSTDTLQSQRDRRMAGLQHGIGGRLVRVTGGRTVVLLPGSTPALAELARRGHDGFDRVSEAFFDADGRVWAEVRAPFAAGQPEVRTVWTGDGSGPLARYLTLPPGTQLAVRGGRAVIDLNPYDYGHSSYSEPLDPSRPPLLKRQ